MQQRAVLRLRMERTTKGRAPAGAPDRPLASSARFAAGFYRPEELPESAGARVRALLFNAAMRPGTPWVRRVDEKSARLAASSLMVPLEVHIADLWSAAAVDHQIVEGDRLAPRFNDLRVDL